MRPTRKRSGGPTISRSFDGDHLQTSIMDPRIFARSARGDTMSDVNQRKADYPVDPQFLARWSPRSFRPEPISNDELMTLFEAARWAPSSYNSQPWNFIYATRESSDWEPFLELLI